MNEVEDYNASLNLKLRSKFKNKGIYSNREVVRAAMKGKLKDAVQTANEVTRKRDEERRKIKKKHGPKTSTTRKILRTFREEAEEIKKKTIEDYKMKISHLRTKNEKLRREEKERVPEEMTDYKDAAAFNRLKYERIEVDEISVTVIGDITLSEEELAVLKLHPKFSIS